MIEILSAAPALLPIMELPPITPTQPPGLGWLTKLVGWVFFLAGLACLAGFGIGAAKVGIAMRNGEYDGGKNMVLALIAFGLLGSASAIFGAVTISN